MLSLHSPYRSRPGDACIFFAETATLSIGWERRAIIPSCISLKFALNPVVVADRRLSTSRHKRLCRRKFEIRVGSRHPWLTGPGTNDATRELSSP